MYDSAIKAIRMQSLRPERLDIERPMAFPDVVNRALLAAVTPQTKAEPTPIQELIQKAIADLAATLEVSPKQIALRGLRPELARLPDPKDPADASIALEPRPAKGISIILGTEDALYRYRFDPENGLTYEGSLPSPKDAPEHAEDPDDIEDAHHDKDPDHGRDPGHVDGSDHADRGDHDEQISDDIGKDDEYAAPVDRPDHPDGSDYADRPDHPDRPDRPEGMVAFKPPLEIIKQAIADLALTLEISSEEISLRGIRPELAPLPDSKDLTDASIALEPRPAKGISIILGTEDALYRYRFDPENGLTYEGSLPSPKDAPEHAEDPDDIEDAHHEKDPGHSKGPDDGKGPGHVDGTDHTDTRDPVSIETRAPAKTLSDADESKAPGASTRQQDDADRHPNEGHVYHWKSHALLRGVSIHAQALDTAAEALQSLGNADVGQAIDAAVRGARALLQAIGTTSPEGTFDLGNIPLGRHMLKAERPLSDTDTGSAVSAADALAALKLSVGLNPNTDPDGDGPLKAPAVSPFQYLAADVNGDGRISAADALGILKMAVKRADAPKREWLFVDEAHDFDSTSDADGRSLFSVSRQSVPKAEDLAPKVETAATRPINLVALLKGDVTGNWSPESDAATLPPTYFDELANARTLMVSSSPVVL